MSLDPHIKKIVDEKLDSLFSDKKWNKKVLEKEKLGNKDPLYSDAEARMAHVLHAVTIRAGQLIDTLYTDAVKVCCPELNVLKVGKFEFKVSREAKSIASTSKHDKDILEHSLTYGKAMKIKGKAKTIQIDLMTYDPIKKIISSYEIKRGGGHHDSGKQEKIIEDLFTVRLLLKSYGERIHNLNVKKARSYVISHMNRDLFAPEYRKFVVKGKDLNIHFNSSNLKQNIELGVNYFASEFKRRFRIIKIEAMKDLTN